MGASSRPASADVLNKEPRLVRAGTRPQVPGTTPVVPTGFPFVPAVFHVLTNTSERCKRTGRCGAAHRPVCSVRTHRALRRCPSASLQCAAAREQ
ncbi:hypothetical protein NDU88_000631 [Pleurodeles waltl]|uniref:Uncharacterized protein n=1 Tax=Pleurodeles waltl TaxID=8319 RepID=A0AAV7Q3F3_PLEWA|nr:hypothetical protein NDU88_000631 [Pleurodeles waltl]